MTAAAIEALEDHRVAAAVHAAVAAATARATELA
jgi:pyrroline-5-carboxylate reductase